MEIVLSQFVKSLAESGLMSADQIDAFINGLPPDKRPDDGAALAKELVKQKKLTKFQAQALYQGKTKLVLGDYVILDRIGQGGMGQVFKAKHKVMKRVVALKTLPASATKSQQAVRRFHREVTVAARLTHPNIVASYDAGESHGLHYLVMEHVQGNDLAAAVRQHGRMPIRKALDYTIQAAKGLEYAHKQKVIHRDIKPSNLLLDKDGTVKVLDMGLARLNQDIGPGDQSEQDTLTGSGKVMGTIDFMPPEQAENTKQADERSDIYSLGCTLYYLLTGQAIYSGDTTVMKILAHRESDVPSLRTELPEVPEQLDGVYQKMVVKQPDDRWDSMAEVITELEKCMEPEPELAETTTFKVDSHIATGLSGIQTRKPADEPQLDLTIPVISPVDENRKKRRKRAEANRKYTVYGLVAVGLAFLFLLLGVVFMVRTPDGTLVVEVNEPDAVVEVLDEKGKVEITRQGETGKLSISVDPGRHRLRVDKSGFALFTREFEIESGGEKFIKAWLAPLQRAKPRTVSLKARAGSSNYALEFDGQSSGVQVLTFDYDGTHPITLEAFVTPKSLVPAHDRYILFSAPVALGIEETGKGHWRLSTEEMAETYLVRSDPLRQIEPVHMAGVFDGTTSAIFLNGMKYGNVIKHVRGLKPKSLKQGETIPNKLRPTEGWALFIGRNWGGGEEFHGLIDEVRISNIARYTKDFTPQKRFDPDEHTMALYHFDEGSGDVLKDSSGNGHHGKILGANWVKVDAPVRVAKDSATQSSPDRRAAEWVLGISGEVHIVMNGLRPHIKHLASLPKQDFRLRVIDAEDCRLVDDARLDNLSGLLELRAIKLSRTNVSDSDLQSLTDLNELVDLDLTYSEVTDAGLTTVGDMRNLRILGLHNTGITDAGLEQLLSLSELRFLDVTGTKVSEVGIDRLTGLPDLVALAIDDRHLTEVTVESLKRMPKLNWLYVNVNRVGKDELAVRLRGLRNLKKLYLRNMPSALEKARLTDHDVAAIKVELPNCTIEATDKSPTSLDELRQLHQLWVWDHSLGSDSTDEPPLR